MKKKNSLLSCVMVLLLSCSSFSMIGCDFLDDTPKEYTIQYSDDTGVHTISVTAGELYYIDTLPEKFGYDFVGLFDAKKGGKQYIDEDGTSVSPFSAKRNIVLYPHFEPKEYTLILDYQGAEVTGSRSMTVSYDAELPQLPTDVEMEYKEFLGWYTKPNAKGIQVADTYGILPNYNKVTEQVFDLENTDRIYLYAGFESAKYNVTLHFGAGKTEEIEVSHGTSIQDIIYDTRVGGNAVLTWSTTENGSDTFHGKIEKEMVLYATEYAPVIEFDTSGGEAEPPIVAHSGDRIELPVPTKENYQFVGWETENGYTFNSTTMPMNSITLHAVWQAMLIFDENGGLEVSDISKEPGEIIVLPIPKKEGYIFAGWYTEEKEEYRSTLMPSDSVKLKAGWYETNKTTVTFIESTKYQGVIPSIYWGDETHKPSTDNLCYTFKYSDCFSQPGSYPVIVEGHVKIKQGTSASLTSYANFYSKKEISSAYLLYTQVFEDVTNSYKAYTFSVEFTVSDDFYACFYLSKEKELYLSDFYCTITYPDTTKLYL